VNDRTHTSRRVIRPAAGAAFGLALVAGGRRLRRVVVEGESMRPTLLPGDRLVVVRGLGAKEGDIVALRDPRQPSRTIVKRVAGLTPDGRVIVSGDHPGASTDSRQFGSVPAALVVGRAVFRYGPEQRRGCLDSGPPPPVHTY
jgi:nickel-type superoxide dismutase maturation protease